MKCVIYQILYEEKKIMIMKEKNEIINNNKIENYKNNNSLKKECFDCKKKKMFTI